MNLDMQNQLKGYFAQVDSADQPIDPSEVAALLNPVAPLPREAEPVATRWRGPRNAFIAAAVAAVLVLVALLPSLMRGATPDDIPSTDSTTPSTAPPETVTTVTPPTTPDVTDEASAPDPIVIVEGAAPPDAPWQEITGADELDPRGVIDGRYYFGQHGRVSHVSTDGVTFEPAQDLVAPPGDGEWGIAAGLFWAQATEFDRLAQRSEDGVVWEFVDGPPNVSVDLWHFGLRSQAVRTGELLAAPGRSFSEDFSFTVVLTSRDNGRSFTAAQPFETAPNTTGFVLGSTGTELIAIQAVGPKELGVAYSTDGATWTVASQTFDPGLDNDFEMTRVSGYEGDAGNYPPTIRHVTGDDRTLFTVRDVDGTRLIRYSRSPGGEPELTVVAHLDDPLTNSNVNVQGHSWAGTYVIMRHMGLTDMDAFLYVSDDLETWIRIDSVRNWGQFLNDRFYEYAGNEDPREPTTTIELRTLLESQ